MARTKYKTLTEQMFYILICLKEECCGIDIMDLVSQITDGRVSIGPGTLYALLGDFVKQGFIRETAVEGRKRSYILTDAGREALRDEYERLKAEVLDYEKSFGR
ncbi:MAG: PadR family transcriptional regulator [Lachnospiraceae bacterium]|nr:PadR family transcriptional regulator [Lachnospiraceae bacterium]